MWTPPDCLFGHWTHSREEDTADAMVYRPGDYAFPRARGRRGVEIRADGTFIRHGIAAADGPQEMRGRWRADVPDRIVVEYEGGHGGEELVILSCEPQLLRLRRA